MILEILLELLLMECGLRLLALVAAGRLLRIEIPLRRLLGLGGIILFAAIAADVLVSELLPHGLARQLAAEALHVAFLAAGLVWLARARFPRSLAAALFTSLLHRLFLILIEATWALIVFRSV